MDKGVYRKIPVRIMGAYHEPVQPYLIESKMYELLQDYKKDLSAMTKLFAEYLNARLTEYLRILG